MKTVVFDFDGVIHKGYNGWKDGSIYGTIDIELMSYIETLMNDYYVVISSNRPAEQIVEHLSGMGYSVELFNKTPANMYWTKQRVIGVTNAKPIGILYVDDHGFRFNPAQETAISIAQIEKILKNEFTNA